VTASRRRTDHVVEDLLRELAPQVLGALVRRFRQFDACEDAVQEALLAAAAQWPEDGVPANPRGWLVTVASRRMTDHVRSESARRRREEVDAAERPADAVVVAAADHDLGAPGDDTLTLLFLCCHPSLSPPSQLALTLRAVGGLTTAEIARAFLVPEATMAQRISRAKQRIRADGATFELPPADERPDRLRVVLQVLYLMFNEGYTTSGGPDLQRTDLGDEAVRLTRAVHRLLPDDGEVAGLLALMILTHARRAARTGPSGELIPLAEQDRSRWDHEAIAEGVDLVTRTLASAALGPYQVQAAIAAVHDEAETAADTDWLQILALYDVLAALAPNPMVTLNHAVARAMVLGPEAGLEMLVSLDDDERMAGHHRLHAVRAHLREMAGDTAAARAGYLEAARRTASTPEQRYLEGRAARLRADADDRSPPR
jgi:RNA polymerase sigma factor (sigma-70 family)